MEKTVPDNSIKAGFAEKLTVFFCVAVLFMFLLLIAGRIIVKNVLYEKLGIYNGFVQVFLEGDDDVENESDFRPVTIDWAGIYPYAPEDIYVPEKESDDKNIIEKYSDKVENIKSLIDWYATTGLVFQTKFTEAAAGYENLIGWTLQEQDYDAVITLDNGHLTCVCPEREIDDIVESVTNFNDFLSEMGIDLIHVMVPFKVDRDNDMLPLGIKDASNSNADRLMSALSSAGIDTIDLRDYEEEDGISHYDMFYYTDHHWNAKSAVWAAKRVAMDLHERYGYEYDPSLFDLSNYDSVIYEDVFLGSYGRRVTLSKAEPEDFEILLPKNGMKFHLTMPEKNMDVTGTFDEVFIDYDMLKITDYYAMDAYSSYVTLRKYVAVIENEDAQNPDKTILILRDSFGNIFAPYFAQQYGRVELVDVSEFTGSIKSYIRESKPDMVLLLYNPTMIEPIDYSTYTGSKYDFR